MVEYSNNRLKKNDLPRQTAYIYIHVPVLAFFEGGGLTSVAMAVNSTERVARNTRIDQGRAKLIMFCIDS